MTMLRLFGVTIVAGLIAGLASTRAQDASAAYIVSYIEVAPSSAQTAAVSVLRALRDTSRKEAGNRGFEVLQRIGRTQQFAILEVWTDAKAQASHAAAARRSRRTFSDVTISNGSPKPPPPGVDTRTTSPTPISMSWSLLRCGGR